MGALEVGHENFGICAKNQNMNEECFGCFEPFYSNSKLSGCFFFFLFFLFAALSSLIFRDLVISFVNLTH